MTPETIGRYRILTKLGQGGMGIVYQAFDPDLNREVALKQITSPDLTQSPEWRQRFRREAQTVGHLKHPNIVTIYDVNLEDKYPYLVMELLTGGTLNDVLARESQSWSSILTLLRPLAEALRYAHRSDVVHRDLKPSNVMFSGDERSVLTGGEARNILKLVDFGLAYRQGGQQVSQAGTIVGTPTYMSPEQANGENVDARTDIFALGLILLEAITGRNPLHKEFWLPLRSEVSSSRPGDRGQQGEMALPQQVINLINRATAINRQERYPTMEIFLNDWDECLAKVNHTSDSTHAPSARKVTPNKPRIRSNVTLSPELKTVLQAMFKNCIEVAVESDFGRGLSGSRILRVSSVEGTGKKRLPAVVKLGPGDLIRQEWQAYKRWVENTLPNIALIESPPTSLAGSQWDGLCYTLAGGGIFEYIPFRDYYQEAYSDQICLMLEENLFQIMSRGWWKNHRAQSLFHLQADYDRLLPVNLLIRPAERPSQGHIHTLEPDLIPSEAIKAGDYVQLKGFVVTEVDQQEGEVTLNWPAPAAEAIPDSFRVRLSNIPGPIPYQKGKTAPPITGRVIATRHDLLLTEARQVLGSQIDLSSQTLKIPFDNRPLPNPLLNYQELLQKSATIYISTIHDDFNIYNILISPKNGEVRLIDFATVRQGHALHDLLRLETEVVTRLMPDVLTKAKLPMETIYSFYQALHSVTFPPTAIAQPMLPHRNLQKPFEVLRTIRNAARNNCLYERESGQEYYQGLIFYMLGALKFEHQTAEAKQIAFWAAATVASLLKEKPATGPLPKLTPSVLLSSSQNLPKRRIFLSYSHSKTDESVAMYLFRFLNDRNQQTFIDQALKVGTAWVDEIRWQIAESDFLVVLLSATSTRSEMLLEEVRFADLQYRETGRPRILPVRLDYEGQLPYELGQYLEPLHYLLWKSEADTPDIAHRLLNAITAESPPSSEQPSPKAGDSVRLAPISTPHYLEKLEPPGGAVPLGSPFYIERQADTKLGRQLRRSNSMTTIQAARQTGKTSLLIRGIETARRRGLPNILLDFQLIDEKSFRDLDTFLLTLALTISDKLSIGTDNVDATWQRPLGAKDRMTYFMENYVLQGIDSALLLAIDEADQLFGTSYYQEFFSLIRAWVNQSSHNPLWKKLHIIMVISTQPYLLINDINQSPFNVGLNLKLNDFTVEQVQKLNTLYDSPLSQTELASMMELLAGHPYLVQQAFYTLKDEEISWAELVKTPLHQGPFYSHLKRCLWKSGENSELTEAMKSVLTKQNYPNERVLIRLEAAGLIRPDQAGSYRCRCQLYEQFFRSYLL